MKWVASTGMVWSSGVTRPDLLYQSVWNWRRIIMVTLNFALASWPIEIERSPKSVWTNIYYVPRMDPPVTIPVLVIGSSKLIINYQTAWPAPNVCFSGDISPATTGVIAAMVLVCVDVTIVKCIWIEVESAITLVYSNGPRLLLHNNITIRWLSINCC